MILLIEMLLDLLGVIIDVGILIMGGGVMIIIVGY
jgi:hypothetical protein